MARFQKIAFGDRLYLEFINQNEINALQLGVQARETKNCKLVKQALVALGRAFHPFTDELSPAHGGFQTWYGPIDGLVAMGPKGYADFVKKHEAQETYDVYKTMKDPINEAVKGEFDYLLKTVLQNPCN